VKIVTVIGARPQFIKAGSVSREIRARQKTGADIEEIIVHTGQHYDENMSEVFFREMQIPKPKYFLGVGGISHGAMTGQMVEKIERVLLRERPDLVLLYGDTNSTLAGAIAASKLCIDVAHVEAGLRSFNMSMPEEVNRVLVDRISTYLFCPTQAAMDNLSNEGIAKWQNNTTLVLTGDVMLDGAKFYGDISKRPENLDISDDFILCTIHRAENTDNPRKLVNIFSALHEIAEETTIVLPIHPRTRKIVSELEINIKSEGLQLIEPVGYLGMVWLINNCSLVMTDSGGLQKEAYFFRKPCVTLRDETEWVELVELGANLLCSANQDDILAAYKVSKNIDGSKFRNELYGAGRASKQIMDVLLGAY